MLQRLVAESTVLGADGIVGIVVSVRRHRLGVVEFAMRGTAVRARSPTRPARVFTTHLPASHVGQLLLAGWVPVALVVGVCAAVTHTDESMDAAGVGGVNVELPRRSGVVTRARVEARNRWAQQIRAVGADHGVLDTMDLRVRDVMPFEQHRDVLPKRPSSAPRSLPSRARHPLRPGRSA